GNDGTEDDRCDDHLDQLDEAVAQRLHGCAGFRGEVPENNTDRDCGQDLEIQMVIKSFGLHVGSFTLLGCLFADALANVSDSRGAAPNGYRPGSCSCRFLRYSS